VEGGVTTSHLSSNAGCVGLYCRRRHTGRLWDYSAAQAVHRHT